MKVKHLGVFFIVFAVIYTVVELLENDGFFNFFLPIALVSSGIVLINRKDREEKIFKKKQNL